MTGAVASDEQLPELRVQIIAGGVATAYSASLERIQDRRSIRSEALPADGVWRFRDVPLWRIPIDHQEQRWRTCPRPMDHRDFSNLHHHAQFAREDDVAIRPRDRFGRATPASNR